MDQSKKNLLKNLIRISVGIAILVFLFARIGVADVYNVVSKANLGILVLALSVTIIQVFLKFVRWKLVFNLIGRSISFFNLAKIYLVGIFLGSVTPSKIGDLFKFYYLKKIHKVPSTYSFSASVLDRIFDLLFVFVVSIIGAIALLGFFPSVYLIAFLSAFFIILVAVFFSEKLFSVFSNFFLPKLSFVLKFFHAKKVNYKTATRELYYPFKLLKSKPQYGFTFVAITFLGWIFLAIQVNLILLALGEVLRLDFLLYFVTMGAVIGLVPVTISGIGTRDAFFVFLFSLFLISSEIALSTSLIYLIFSQMIPAIFGGFYYFNLKKK